MTTKIKNKLEKEIRELAQKGYNCRATALKVGLNPETVRQWAIRNSVIFQTGKLEVREKEPKFIELLKNGWLHKHACKELGVDSRMGKEWAIKNGLDDTLRTRADSAKDKQLTMEEANDRLPAGHGSIVGYDKTLGKYIIQRADRTTYHRITSQIFRGDPQKSQKPRIDEKEAAEILLAIGYRLIPGTFRIKREPVQAEHIKCGYVRENVMAMFSKQSCPRCSNTGTSKEEASLDTWVKSLGVDSQKFRFKKDYIGKGKGKEIDIYVPGLKFGIEYCGFYHHGEKQTLHSLQIKIDQHESRNEKYEKTDFDSPKWKHKAKLDKANSLSIQLITVFEHEWKKSPEKVKAVLKAKMGKNQIKIFARKTEVKEIDKKQSKEFLDAYHLQGDAPTLIRFGLFYENQLIAVITGNHHHRIKGQFVLNRLCFKADITVVGGASKLNKALEIWAKNQGIGEIISWSDNRWSSGGVYKALGYSQAEDVPPDYFYFGGNGKFYSKQSCQKKNLLKRGASGNTEWEMAQSLKLDRIYDCGKKTWVKKLI